MSHREHVAATAAPQGQLKLVALDGTSSVLNYSHSSACKLTLWASTTELQSQRIYK
jgi:hypothetical protein